MQKTSNILNSYLSNLLGVELFENQKLKNSVNDYYKSCNLPQEKDIEFEYLIPKNAIAISNPNGKTQGFLTKIGDTEIFVLPNNSEELKIIYNDCILDYLEKNHPINYKSETYKTFGLNEQYIKSILKDNIKNKDNISVSVFSNGLNNDVVIKSKESNQKFEEYRRDVFSKLEKYIYSVQDLTLKQMLEKEISLQNIKVSFAGDLSISWLISDISASIRNNVAECVIMPNTNAIATFLAETVNELSAEVAYNVAVKMLDKTKSDLALVSVCNLSPNGIAETYIAIGNNVKIDIYKNKFVGSQQEILNNISQTAMFYLVKRLKLKDVKTIK